MVNPASVGWIVLPARLSPYSAMAISTDPLAHRIGVAQGASRAAAAAPAVPATVA